MTLTVAAGLDMIRSRTLAMIGLCVAVALSAVSLERLHERPDPEPWREIAGYIVARAEPGDGLIVHPGSGRLAFEYHADDAVSFTSALQPAVPSEPWGELSFVDPPFSRTADEDTIKAATAPFGRIWFVTDQADNALRDRWAAVRAKVDHVLGERCQTGTSRQFGRYRVTRYDCTAADTLG
jgi:hypothetical protein